MCANTLIDVSCKITAIFEHTSTYIPFIANALHISFSGDLSKVQKRDEVTQSTWRVCQTGSNHVNMHTRSEEVTWREDVTPRLLSVNDSYGLMYGGQMPLSWSPRTDIPQKKNKGVRDLDRRTKEVFTSHSQTLSSWERLCFQHGFYLFTFWYAGLTYQQLPCELFSVLCFVYYFHICEEQETLPLPERKKEVLERRWSKWASEETECFSDPHLAKVRAQFQF